MLQLFGREKAQTMDKEVRKKVLEGLVMNHQQISTDDIILDRVLFAIVRQHLLDPHFLQQASALRIVARRVAPDGRWAAVEWESRDAELRPRRS